MTATHFNVKTAPKPRPQVPPAEASTWQVYEQEKSKIADTAQSIDEYENAIRALCKRLGL